MSLAREMMHIMLSWHRFYQQVMASYVDTDGGVWAHFLLLDRKRKENSSLNMIGHLRTTGKRSGAIG